LIGGDFGFAICDWRSEIDHFGFVGFYLQFAIENLRLRLSAIHD
jgi:hypothetical protein